TPGGILRKAPGSFLPAALPPPHGSHNSYRSPPWCLRFPPAPICSEACAHQPNDRRRNPSARQGSNALGFPSWNPNSGNGRLPRCHRLGDNKKETAFPFVVALPPRSDRETSSLLLL